MTSKRSAASPRKARGAALCVVVKKDGTTVYANRAAFRSLADWMLWIAESDPVEHFELHLPWHLSNHLRAAPNTWLLYHKDLARGRSPDADAGGAFEITFMNVANTELDGIRRGRVLGPAFSVLEPRVIKVGAKAGNAAKEDEPRRLRRRTRPRSARRFRQGSA